MSPRYGPPDASQAPRYAGVRTFARCPLVDSPEGVDVAAIGIPFDTATSNRPGARFGPEAIRACSIALRPYHPALDVDVIRAWFRRDQQEIVDSGLLSGGGSPLVALPSAGENGQDAEVGPARYRLAALLLAHHEADPRA